MSDSVSRFSELIARNVGVIVVKMPQAHNYFVAMNHRDGTTIIKGTLQYVTKTLTSLGIPYKEQDEDYLVKMCGDINTRQLYRLYGHEKVPQDMEIVFKLHNASVYTKYGLLRQKFSVIPMWPTSGREII